jgi:predicted Zn finger-like uncharacterized protein
MNVSCPQCKTVFRVDPRKVPAEGVRARCSVCGGVFEVVPEMKQAAPAGAPAAGGPASAHPAAGQAQAAPAGPAAPAPPASAQPMPPAAPGEAAARPQPAAPVPPPPPAPAPPAAPPARPFGQADPEARARRLARALVSDVAAYHPERQEIGLREGRLKELFQEELKKSWQEYVEQVGIDVARSTPYFRDALNEILARGKKVF